MGLLSHQILIQTIGCLLLKDCSNMVSLERDVINSSLPSGDCTESDADKGDLMHDAHLPGNHLSVPDCCAQYLHWQYMYLYAIVFVCFNSTCVFDLLL